MSRHVFLLCVTISTFSGVLVAHEGKSQKLLSDFRVTLKEENAALLTVLGKIEAQTEFKFSYLDDLDRNFRVSIKANNKRLDKVLETIALRTKFSFKRVNGMIAVSKIKERSSKKVKKDIGDIEKVSFITRGKVTDENGESLPGVSILEKGTTNGVITDVQGRYQLEVANENAILIFSYVGYSMEEIPVNGRAQIDITLLPDIQALQEVVVVGYGTQQSREVSGSIVSVKTEKLEDQPVGTVFQRLQGQLAGVQINQTSGRPGRGMSIRIRGAASINAGNTPLFVVDGLPVFNGLNDINPNEIEDISVLKGAAAASLYGSRAANGVVLVTTKQARKGQGKKLHVDVTTGIGVMPENLKPDVMNAKEFLTSLKFLWEDGIRYLGWDAANMPEEFKDPDAWTGPDTDWYDELLRSSQYHDYNITFSNGAENVQTSNILNYHEEKGTILNTKYRRFSIRSNNVFSVNDNIKAGVNVAPAFSLQNGPNPDGNYNIIYAAVTSPPFLDPDEIGPDGKRVGAWVTPSPVWDWANPKKILLENISRTQTLNLFSNAYAEVDFLRNFQMRSAVSVEYHASQGRFYTPSTVGIQGAPWIRPPKIASGGSSSSFRSSWLWENTLKYNKTIHEDHYVEAMVTYSAQRNKAEGVSGSGDTFADDEIPFISAATNTRASVGTSSWSLASILGRLNYNYRGKYLLSATFRRDGSSRFGSQNRWGSFPSISAGWIISDEGFAENLPVLSFLKLRAEYGKVGNFNIGNYSHFGGISSANYVINGGVVEGRIQNSIGNSALTWETTKGLGIGLDAAIFKDRISLTFDYYKKTTDGLLYSIAIPIATGFSAISSNIGEFDFWGYEFSVSSKNLTGEFTWNTNFNISFDRNKVIKLGTEDNPIGGGGGWPSQTVNRTEVGQPIGQFWGWVSEGIYETQEELDSQPKGAWNTVGSARYKDLNGDGIVTDTDDDKTYLGNPQADFTFGMTNSFSYKNFDMSILITGSYGNEMQYAVREWTENLEGNFNQEKYILDRWRSPENPGSGRVAGSATGNAHLFRRLSNNHIFDASYLTIKNITLGYNFPKFGTIIQSARIYGSIQQVLVITSYPGANPEASNQGSLFAGVDAGNYPVPRTFALGLNLTF